MLQESYRLSVIWSRLCPVNLPRISRVCCWSCWPGPESVLRMGSRLAKCRVIEGTVKNGAAVRGVMQVFALLVPGGFFLSFFPCFYYCVFLLFIWCCGWLFSLSQWSVFGKQWLLTKKRNTATVVFPLPLGMWLSEKSAVMFMSKCQWCCSWVNVLAKRLTSGEFVYMFTLYARCKSCWQNVWCAPVFYWECRRECALNILQVWETACVSPVSFAGVWGNRRSWPVSHLCVLQVFGATGDLCVLQVFGATGEAGLCLTCVFCRCLGLARVSPVCCADVWSNKRSGLCVVKGVQNHKRSWCVAEHAIGAAVTNVSCVFCRCSGAPGVLSLPVSPVCHVSFLGVENTRRSGQCTAGHARSVPVTSVTCAFCKCSEHQMFLVYLCHQCFFPSCVWSTRSSKLTCVTSVFFLQVFGAPVILSLPVSPVFFAGVWSTRSSKFTCVTSVFCRCSEHQEF